MTDIKITHGFFSCYKVIAAKSQSERHFPFYRVLRYDSSVLGYDFLIPLFLSVFKT